MRFCALGSGSQGNAWIVESSRGKALRPTRVMVDCGFTLKETVARLQVKGLNPSDLQAVLVTHEHDDHVSGVYKFARKFSVPVYSTLGTFRASVKAGLVDSAWVEAGRAKIFCPETPWNIGDLNIQPFTVPHDAAEPAQFTIEDAQMRLGIMTDCGRSTPHVVQRLSGCDALVLESNHDHSMLLESQYPGSLKRRISSDYGHLSNDAAHEILAAINRDRLRCLVAAHLSLNTNSTDCVKKSWSKTLNHYQGKFAFADQAMGTQWLNI